MPLLRVSLLGLQKSKFELLVSHQHADDVVCMKCHSEKVRRLLSVFALANGEEDSPTTTWQTPWVEVAPAAMVAAAATSQVELQCSIKQATGAV